MSTAKHVREIPALCSPSQSSRADVMWSMRLVASSFKVAICFWNSTTNEWDQQWQQFFLGLGSFDNNDGSGNEEFKNVLNTSLPSLHDYDMKSLTVRQYRGSKHTTTNFGSVPYNSFYLHLMFYANWNDRDRFWKNTKIIFNSDVFAAIAVVIAKAPYFVLCCFNCMKRYLHIPSQY